MNRRLIRNFSTMSQYRSQKRKYNSQRLDTTRGDAKELCRKGKALVHRCPNVLCCTNDRSEERRDNNANNQRSETKSTRYWCCQVSFFESSKKIVSFCINWKLNSDEANSPSNFFVSSMSVRLRKRSWFGFSPQCHDVGRTRENKTLKLWNHKSNAAKQRRCSIHRRPDLFNCTSDAGKTCQEQPTLKYKKDAMLMLAADLLKRPQVFASTGKQTLVKITRFWHWHVPFCKSAVTTASLCINWKLTLIQTTR